MAMLGESRRLSLTAPGSSTKAVFGAVSGVEVDVTQSGEAPLAFVAVQPDGSEGADTPSKLWLKFVVSGPTTDSKAADCPEPPSVLVKLAVLDNVAPQEPLVVELTTCARVLVLAASVVGL